MVMVYISYLEMKTTCEFDINNTAYKYSTLRKLTSSLLVKGYKVFCCQYCFQRAVSAMYYIHAIVPPPQKKMPELIVVKQISVFISRKSTKLSVCNVRW